MGKRTTIGLINVYNVDITDLSFACVSITQCLLEVSCTWAFFANTVLSCFKVNRKVSCEKGLRLYLRREWREDSTVCVYRKRKDRGVPRDPKFPLGKLVKLCYFYIFFSVYQVIFQYDSSLDLSHKHMEGVESMMKTGRRWVSEISRSLQQGWISWLSFQKAF